MIARYSGSLADFLPRIPRHDQHQRHLLHAHVGYRSKVREFVGLMADRAGQRFSAVLDSCRRGPIPCLVDLRRRRKPAVPSSPVEDGADIGRGTADTVKSAFATG